MKHTGYLIVSAAGDMRVVRRMPSTRMRGDEVAYKVVVNVPDGWAGVRGSISIDMPEPPDDAVVAEQLEAPSSS